MEAKDLWILSDLWICYQWAAWPRGSYITSLNLSFHFCKMRVGHKTSPMKSSLQNVWHMVHGKAPCVTKGKTKTFYPTRSPLTWVKKWPDQVLLVICSLRSLYFSLSALSTVCNPLFMRLDCDCLPPQVSELHRAGAALFCPSCFLWHFTCRSICWMSTSFYIVHYAGTCDEPCHGTQYLTLFSSFYPHSSRGRLAILSSFYRWGNWGSR